MSIFVIVVYVYELKYINVIELLVIRGLINMLVVLFNFFKFFKINFIDCFLKFKLIIFIL